MSTPTESAVLANLRHEWAILHKHFRLAEQENQGLRTFILLYATVTDEENRREIDGYLAKEFPQLWQDVQLWRQVDAQPLWLSESVGRTHA